MKWEAHWRVEGRQKTVIFTKSDVPLRCFFKVGWNGTTISHGVLMVQISLKLSEMIRISSKLSITVENSLVTTEKNPNWLKMVQNSPQKRPKYPQTVKNALKQS